MSGKRWFTPLLGAGFGRAGAAAVVLTMNALVARSVGRESAGHFFLALGIVTVTSALARRGTDQGLVRLVAALPGPAASAEAGVIFKCAVRRVLPSCCGAAFLVFLFAGYIPLLSSSDPDLALILRGMAPAVVSTSLLHLVGFAMQGLGRVTEMLVAQSIGTSGLMALVALFLEPGRWVGAWYSSVSGLVLIVVLLRQRRVLLAGKGAHGLPSTLGTISKPLWVVTVMVAAQQWSAQIVGALFLSAASIAYLGAAQRVALTASLALVALNLVLAPRLSRSFSEDRIADFEALSRASISVGMILSVPITVVAIVFAGNIMELFGDGFSAGQNVFRIAIIGNLFNAASGSVQTALIMSGNERAVRNVSVAVGPVAIAAAAVGAKYWGAPGAALSTTAVVAAQNLVSLLILRRRLEISVAPLPLGRIAGVLG